jgi:hypothetical protein
VLRNHGPGIFIDPYGVVRIEQSTVADNDTTGSLYSGYASAGISAFYPGRLEIVNSTISGNRCRAAGGIWLDQVYVDISDSTISGNHGVFTGGISATTAGPRPRATCCPGAP